MKKLFAVLILLASALSAQQITGSWQGTLSVNGHDLRIVIKIATEDDKLKATMYSIDQGGQAIPATVTRDGATVKVGIAAIGGGWEGKLGGDPNTMVGTWNQGGALPLTLVRSTPATAWTIPEPPPPPKRMDAKADPTFEVSTIKPSKPDSPFFITVNPSGLVTTGNTSLRDLIKFAYDLHPKQISGGPAWLETEKFDVTGKPDAPGLPSIVQMKTMVKKLLTDRFQLTFHREKKELSVYAITAVKTGIKMTKNDSNPNGLPGFGGGARGLVVRNATMSEFASMLQANILEQPVVDQSGLGESRYDFVLRWTPDAALPGSGAAAGAGGGDAAAAASSPDAPPDLFTAFTQQLGLRLARDRAPVDVLVLDKAEKPSAN